LSLPIPVLHPITRLIVGGAQENTMYTAARLDKTRFAAIIVSGPQTGSEGSLIETVRELGVSLEILPELVREINPWKEISALWKLYRLIKTGNFIIVHTHSSKAGILGRIAAKLAGAPIIVHTVHGWSFHDRMNPILRQIYIRLEKFCVAFTDAMIVVADQDIKKGLQAGIGPAGQYHLIRSAIPLDQFSIDNVDKDQVRRELGLPLYVPVLGNVGRFSPQKNPLDWLRVAKLIAERVPNCFFLMVGDGPLRSEVEALIADFGLSDRFVLTGLRRDVPQLMAAMDVFLLTSLWEGLPRVIPQAMAMGLPVIANRADGTIEAIDHGRTGFLCDPGSLTEMANYCIKLLTDLEQSQKMGLRGQAFAHQEFDLDNMISQIERLYNDLSKEK
jgi:glycosyltransferase involved in cell wall biosynthesis